MRCRRSNPTPSCCSPATTGAASASSWRSSTCWPPPFAKAASRAAARCSSTRLIREPRASHARGHCDPPGRRAALHRRARVQPEGLAQRSRRSWFPSSTMSGAGCAAAAGRAEEMIALDGGTSAVSQQLAADQRARARRRRRGEAAARGGARRVVRVDGRRIRRDARVSCRRSSVRPRYGTAGGSSICRTCSAPSPDRRMFLDYCHLTGEGLCVAVAAIAAAIAPIVGVDAAPPSAAGCARVGVRAPAGRDPQRALRTTGGRCPPPRDPRARLDPDIRRARGRARGGRQPPIRSLALPRLGRRRPRTARPPLPRRARDDARAASGRPDAGRRAGGGRRCGRPRRRDPARGSGSGAARSAGAASPRGDVPRRDRPGAWSVAWLRSRHGANVAVCGGSRGRPSG